MLLSSVNLLGVTGAGLFKLAVNPETLVMILAGLLAVLFDWFPGLRPWFDGLSRTRKRLVMTGLLSLVAGLIFAGSCKGLFETGVACTVESLPLLLQYILSAAAANQAVHLLVKPAAGGRG